MKRKPKAVAPSVESLESRVVLSSAKVLMAALGDSYTDEYRFYPPDRSHARNWVEILSASGQVGFGPYTAHSRGNPRYQGFALDWALQYADSNQMVQNQLPGLTAQVRTGKVGYVSILIGGNDFLEILKQVPSMTPAQLQALPTQITQTGMNLIANFDRAVVTLLQANPKVKLAVSTVSHLDLLPAVKAGETSPQLTAIVDACNTALDAYNAHIRAVAASNPRVALVDLAAQTAALAQNSNGAALFGGTALNLAQPGDEYHHFFLADGIHIGTVAQGIVADSVLSALHDKFGTRVHLFSAAQIVHYASRIR